MSDSVTEIDNNPDAYVGLSFPLGYSNQGFFRQTQKLNEQVKSNIRNLLLTAKGERVMQPTFGSDLQNLLFENITDNLNEKIEQTITEAIEEWLPYVQINNIFVVHNELVPNEVQVQLEFSITIEPDQLDTITFNFTLGD